MPRVFNFTPRTTLCLLVLAASAAAAEAGGGGGGCGLGRRAAPTFRVHDGHVSSQSGGVAVNSATMRTRPRLVERQKALILHYRVRPPSAPAVTAAAVIAAAADARSAICRQRREARQAFSAAGKTWPRVQNLDWELGRFTRVRTTKAALFRHCLP